tara:strand:- start:38 stop:724 length:687 start_codon:yes stop_codon:yes gene_type:complete
MPDYQLGKIYLITSETNKLLYIGSTCQKYLSTRIQGHVSDYKNDSKKKCCSYKLLECDDYNYKLLKDFPCSNIQQLRREEGVWILHYKEQTDYECVNKNIAGRTLKEYYQKNRDKIKEYYEANLDKFKAYREANLDKAKAYREANRDKAKAYREANRDKAKEYQEKNREKKKEYDKKRRENNKDKILAENKEYYQKNRDKILAEKQEYYQKNKDKILAQMKEYYKSKT